MRELLAIEALPPSSLVVVGAAEVGSFTMDLPEEADRRTDVIATELLNALDTCRLLTPMTVRDPGFSVDAAYEVSAELWRRRRVRGEQPIGPKIGFTNRAIWSEYGVYTPIWAYLYDSTVTFLEVPLGRAVISHLAQPRLEPEIVLHFRSSPRVTTDEAELLSHINWIAHGFEIVQCHFPNWKFQVADTIADFGLHGALIVGPRHPVVKPTELMARLHTFTTTMARDGVVQLRGGGANVLGSPLLALAHLLSLLKEQPGFDPIRAGEVVTTGSLTALAAISVGETWSTEFSGIDLDGLRVEIQ